MSDSPLLLIGADVARDRMEVLIAGWSSHAYCPIVLICRDEIDAYPDPAREPALAARSKLFRPDLIGGPWMPALPRQLGRRARRRARGRARATRQALRRLADHLDRCLP